MGLCEGSCCSGFNCQEVEMDVGEARLGRSWHHRSPPSPARPARRARGWPQMNKSGRHAGV